MSNLFDLNGKVAVITGSSRGIGKAIASELGKRGATVIINYLKNHSAAQATVDELEAAGVTATRIKAHVGDEAAEAHALGDTETPAERPHLGLLRAGAGDPNPWWVRIWAHII